MSHYWLSRWTDSQSIVYCLNNLPVLPNCLSSKQSVARLTAPHVLKLYLCIQLIPHCKWVHTIHKPVTISLQPFNMNPIFTVTSLGTFYKVHAKGWRLWIVYHLYLWASHKNIFNCFNGSCFVQRHLYFQEWVPFSVCQVPFHNLKHTSVWSFTWMNS